MKRNTVSNSRKPVNFPSPGTPIKGWQSERVSFEASGYNRRQLGTASVSFNNGRNLPSKWEDAERWIFSPVASDGNGRPSRLQPQKRPKSKSGPLGAPGVAYYAQYSPGISMYDDSGINSLIAAAGVLMPAAVSGRQGRRNGCLQNKGERICQSSGASSQDEKLDDPKAAAAANNPNMCGGVSKKDAATQMSPEGSPHSSSRRNSSSNSTKPDIRDVQVDERVTITRYSKKHRSQVSGEGAEALATETHSSTWEDSEASKNLSGAQREEAKITAWENLQKAKAEAAIRKLEMKLEKKRSRTIDKIMAKLRSAEKKAQEMRSFVLANQETQVPKTSFKAIPFSRTWQMGSLGGCFTCKAL